MKKYMKVVAITVILALFLTGCDDSIYTEQDIDNEIVMEPTYSDNLEEIHELVRSQDLGGFTLIAKYDTMDYDLNKWKIIDNKAIRMSVWTEGLPSGWEAIIEHVHIDMFITNKYKEFPTLLQDSMDDSYHGYQQDGFRISDEIVYNNVFGVIGATPELHAMVDYSASYTLQLKDLRETRFINRGYTMNTMQVVYDVMVKKPGNDFYETIAVYDEIIIPANYTGE